MPRSRPPRLRLEGMRHMGFTDLIPLLDGAGHEARFGTIVRAWARSRS